jgi:nucleotide-binding universal stress UspA family protein
MNFTSIVVPVDLEEHGDRAIQYARRLAAAARLRVELLTVSSPSIAEGPDVWELRRRATVLEDGGVPCSYVVVHGDDPAMAIVEHTRERPGALLAMSTHVRGVLGERLFGSVSEAVLTHHAGPVLLFGPAFEAVAAETPPTLIAALDEQLASEAVLEAVEAWSSAFGGDPPWLVEAMEPMGLWAGGGVALVEATHVRRLAQSLAERGLHAQWEVLHGRHAADSIVEFAGRMGDAVIALASARWTDPEQRHLISVTRAVARRSRCPVLVVPVGHDVSRQGSDDD